MGGGAIKRGRDTTHLGAGDPGAVEALAFAAAPGHEAHLADAYRRHGWRAAQLDPLGLSSHEPPGALDPARWPGLEDLADALEAVYCGTLGWEIGHVQDEARFAWLAAEAERGEPLSREERAHAAWLVAAGEAFEGATLKRLPTVKTFGMSGAESFMVAVDAAIRASGAREVVIGGMHRGRSTQLALIYGKSIARIVAEFRGVPDIDPSLGASSDVPYHLGFEGERPDGIKVWLGPIPSHLSLVATVATGRARARPHALPLMLHTDAAFAGQGVNMELMQLSALAGYTVGGSIHMVLDNQVGFTTGAEEARSARSAADVAKLVEAPILHVNGDDPDALLLAGRTAARYRARFGADIVVNVLTYRRRAHNEMEEARFTQPVMVGAIEGLAPVSQRYLARTGLPAPDLSALTAEFEAAFDASPAIPNLAADVSGLAPDVEARMAEPVDTGVDTDRLARLLTAIATPPAGVEVHPRILQFLERRRAMADGRPLDYPAAEALALAALLDEGFGVRLSGQDSARGAFAQRHLLLHDQRDGRPHNVLSAAGERAEVFNSPLIENAVLGFEYGFSAASPDTLTVWEAQFGDFLNVCQSIFDLYVVGGEDRWLIRSALTMMLPHGWDGGGPDHSTGHLERVLPRCARGNIRVAMPTTPANVFHLLRRQMHTPLKKPLVLYTPKKMLRMAECASPLAAFGPGTGVQSVIAEDVADPSRVIIAAGKVAYTLASARAERGQDGEIAIVRLEELYPFPARALADALARWPGAEVVFVQEEPANLGAFTWLDRRLEAVVGRRVPLVSRPVCPSPAVGWAAWHAAEEARLIEAALEVPARAARAAE